MKLLIYFLLFTTSQAAYSKSVPAKLIEKKQLEIQSTINKAALCSPDIRETSYTFCSGKHYSKKELVSISSQSFEQCIGQIKRMNFDVLLETKVKDTNKNDFETWKTFIQSDNSSSMTDFSKGIVFFRKHATRLDCLEEFLTIKNNKFKNAKSTLSLYSMKKMKDEFRELLDDSVDGVEWLIKAGRDKEAEKKAALVQKGINVKNGFDQFVPMFNDVEINTFFLFNCKKLLNCSDADYENVIGKLNNMSNVLPWKVKNFVISEARKIVKQKEQLIIKNFEYIGLSDEQLKVIDSLSSQELAIIFEFIEKNKIQVISILEMNEEKKKLLFRVQRGQLGLPEGKFVCSKSGEKYIFLKDKSKKGVVLREVVHFFQSQKNPNFCDIDIAQDELKQQFSQNIISKNDFEENVLKLKTLIWKTELEAYSLMLKYPALFDKQENLNNQIQKLVFETRLSPPKDVPATALVGKIKFKEENDLIFILLNNQKYYLDLGAMDTVIHPEDFFDLFKEKKYISYDFKTLQTVTGTSAEAPLVRIDDAFKIDGAEIHDFNFSIANLKIPNIRGVIGLSLFRNTDFIIRPEKGEIEITQIKKMPKNSLLLQKDLQGNIQSLEFDCGKGKMWRLDSGSQVYADIENANVKTCANLNLTSKDIHISNNKIIFSRGVSANLGWPFMKQFKEIYVSTRSGKIGFNGEKLLESKKN